MKQYSLLFLTAVATGTTGMSAAFADEIALGAGVIGQTSVYRGDNGHVYPFPLLNYDSQYVYFRGLEGGYYLWRDEQDKLSLTARYSPLGFKPGDSSDSRLQQLDRRRGTLMAGLAYQHEANWGTFRTSLTGDTLDYSNGLEWDSAYLYRITTGNWSLTPGMGVVWSSENQNRYYYGITGDESVRSGLSRYQPDDSWSPYAELNVGYRLTENWNAWLNGRYVLLSDDIKNSPMVDKSYHLMLGGGVSYRF
ncbi:MipA/OmpV family protein [Musicola paradisiaca]|uniref:MltA-interacting MipA family protein n=1 Tax=Musicola paradisiaca (strain Ech703) TaxID=579405 RepID=C6C5X5_MUSP7|nr:MltA-interacting MipA family protein [Musicola paradisiaca Ech703]